MTVFSAAVVCALLTTSLYAQLRSGILDEELTGDVVVVSVSPTKIVMGIGSNLNGRDGRVDHAFGVRSSTPFPEKVSMRLENARVVVSAEYVFVKSADGRAVVFATDDQCAVCTAGPKDRLYRFVGYEVVRRADPMPPFKKIEGANGAVTRLVGDYWNPCVPDASGTIPPICSE